LAQVRVAFPDFTVTIEELLVVGDKVVQRSRQSGTFEGEFQSLVPNGQSFETEGIVIYLIADGKIFEELVQSSAQPPRCRKCGSHEVVRLFSAFATRWKPSNVNWHRVG
jgi:hypothetical protein